MRDDTQDDELIRQAAACRSVPPDVISQLLALAPRFENINIYGMKPTAIESVSNDLNTSDF